MPAIYPYGASLNVVCTTSNKRGMTIDAYMSSTNYTSKEDYIGKGLSYFIESTIQPMSMTYECSGINGDLVEIDTNLHYTINDGENISVTTERKITNFTIDNFDWFNENSSQEIFINKKINQVEIKLDFPYYNNASFKRGSSTISYSTKTSNTTDSIFCFDVTNNIIVGTEIQATYNTKVKKEENLIAYKYNNYSRIKTTESWIENEIKVYKKNDDNIISIINNDFNNKTLILNNNQVIENENLIVSYYINSEDVMEEFLPILRENDNSYIQLNNVWTEVPQIYSTLENSITIDNTYPTSKRIRFKRADIPEGTLIKVEYKNTDNEDRIEYLTAEYISSYGSAYTVIFTKESFKTTPKPNAFKITIGNEIHIKQENSKNKIDLDNKIIYLNNNEIENINYVKVSYNYPVLKNESVRVNNDNSIVLSNFWIENLFNEIKIYKLLEIDNSNFTYNLTSKYIQFPNNIVFENEVIFVEYNYIQKINGEIHLAEESKKTTTYEGDISALSNNIIIKCFDLQNNEISYGITNNNNNIFVNEKYSEQNIIVYYKEKPYINLCCNNVKVECDFFVMNNMYNNFSSLQLDGEDSIKIGSKDKHYVTLNRYITVHWNKESYEGCSIGLEDKDTYYINRKQVFLKSDGTYGETEPVSMAWYGNPEWSSNENFTIPPLNGTTPISKNSNTYYKNFYKLLYNIRPTSEGSSQWTRGTRFFIKNSYPIYKENGMIQYISGTRRINTGNNAPILYNLPIWGNEKVFYKTEDGYYISPASGGLLITGWALSAEVTTADDQGFVSFRANYNENYNIRTGPGGKYGIAQFIKASNTVTVIGEQEDDENKKWYNCIFQARTESGGSTTATGWVIEDGISR